MKFKHLFLVLILCMQSGWVSAQDWSDFFKKKATEAVDELSQGAISGLQIKGQWTYSAPGFKMETDDFLAQMAGMAVAKAVEPKLETVYEQVGLKAGVGQIEFLDNNEFVAKSEKYTVKGTYQFDGKTKEITFHFDTKVKQIPEFTGKVSIVENKLKLLFPVKKLVDMARKSGTKSSSLDKIAKMLKKYEEVYLGFEFTKVGKAAE